MKNPSEFQIELNRNNVPDVNPFSIPLKQKCSCQQHGWLPMKMKAGAKIRKSSCGKYVSCSSYSFNETPASIEQHLALPCASIMLQKKNHQKSSCNIFKLPTLLPFVLQT